MLEIMRKAATVAIGLVGAAGVDDHLEFSWRVTAVADEEHPVGDLNLTGFGKACPPERQEGGVEEKG